MPFTTVVATVDATAETLTVDIPAGSAAHSSGAFGFGEYPAFSDDDVLVALSAGTAARRPGAADTNT